MKRIKFNHDEDNIIKALGFSSPEKIEKAAASDDHPDRYKLRFIAALLNGTATSNLSLLNALIYKAPLSNSITQQLEILFDKLPDSQFAELDERIGLYDAKSQSVQEATEAMTKELGAENV